MSASFKWGATGCDLGGAHGSLYSGTPPLNAMIMSSLSIAKS